jgi:hypothetical protein
MIISVNHIKFLGMKNQFFVQGVFVFLLVTVISCSNGYYTSWEHNKKVNNIDFSKIRYGINNNDTSVIIGFLKNKTVIQGYPCGKDWVQFNKDWKLILFKLDDKIVINNFRFPKNSWIRQNNDKLVCVFPSDTVIQEYLCRGSGGSNGVQTSIYPNGKLESFFTKGNIMIGEINCKGGVFNNIILYDNGALKECTLSEDQIIKGISYKKGTRINIDLNGNIIIKK